MKLFNNHSGSRGLPRFAEGIHWATGSSLTTPFTEGCPGVNDKASPPGRHQEQAPKQRCTFRPHAMPLRSVQFSSTRGPWSCLSVRTQPLTATGAPSQTSTMPCHTHEHGELACMEHCREPKGAC